MVYATPFGYSTKQYVPNYAFLRKKEKRPYIRTAARRETRNAIRDQLALA